MLDSPPLDQFYELLCTLTSDAYPLACIIHSLTLTHTHTHTHTHTRTHTHTHTHTHSNACAVGVPKSKEAVLHFGRHARPNRYDQASGVCRTHLQGSCHYYGIAPGRHCVCPKDALRVIMNRHQVCIACFHGALTLCFASGWYGVCI